MKNSLVKIPLLVTALSLSGCQYEQLYRAEAMSPAAGNAIAHNTALQVTDPWPRSSANNNLEVPAVKYGGEPKGSKGPPSPKLTKSQTQ